MKRRFLTLSLGLSLGLLPLLLSNCSSAPTTMGMGQKIYLKSMLPSLNGSNQDAPEADADPSDQHDGN